MGNGRDSGGGGVGSIRSLWSSPDAEFRDKQRSKIHHGGYARCTPPVRPTLSIARIFYRRPFQSGVPRFYCKVGTLMHQSLGGAGALETQKGNNLSSHVPRNPSVVDGVKGRTAKRDAHQGREKRCIVIRCGFG